MYLLYVVICCFLFKQCYLGWYGLLNLGWMLCHYLWNEFCLQLTGKSPELSFFHVGKTLVEICSCTEIVLDFRIGLWWDIPFIIFASSLSFCFFVVFFSVQTSPIYHLDTTASCTVSISPSILMCTARSVSRRVMFALSWVVSIVICDSLAVDAFCTSVPVAVGFFSLLSLNNIPACSMASCQYLYLKCVVVFMFECDTNCLGISSGWHTYTSVHW